MATPPTHLATSALCGGSSDVAVAPLSDEIFRFMNTSNTVLKYSLEKFNSIVHENTQILHQNNSEPFLSGRSSTDLNLVHWLIKRKPNCIANFPPFSLK